MNEDAIRRELERLDVMDRHPGLSELALSLARSADMAVAPTALAAVAAQLRAVMKDLCSLATPAEEGDALDELKIKRERRLSS